MLFLIFGSFRFRNIATSSTQTATPFSSQRHQQHFLNDCAQHPRRDALHEKTSGSTEKRCFAAGRKSVHMSYRTQE